LITSIMKIAVVVGWTLLVVEGLIIASMFVQPNMGDDAAGRGMARGFAIVLGPIMLAAAALFVWGQRGGPAAAFWGGLGVMAIPLVVIVQKNVVGTFNRLDRAQGEARYGKFSDARLTRSRARDREGRHRDGTRHARRGARGLRREKSAWAHDLRPCRRARRRVRGARSLARDRAHAAGRRRDADT